MVSLTDIYELFSESYLVDTDTRKIRKNSVFFALKGENFNGNLFALEALNKGAKYAVVDESHYTHPNIILVDNVLKTLQDLANYHRKKLGIPIIALTGSNGKTTTKELISVVLSKKFKTFATLGNLNNHIGVPLTLLSMDHTIQFGVVEMGANHIGEIEELTAIVEPDYGYITNFGKAHLEGFGSVEGVIKGKSELYDFIEKENKLVFVNHQDALQVKKTDKLNSIMFNESISLIEANPFVSFMFDKTRVDSNLIGKYNYNNIAAAVTIGDYFGVEKALIIEAIKAYVPKNNRSQIIVTKSNKIILDAYNANPSSMNAAISNFKELKASSKIVILGDMFELGQESIIEHQKINDKLEKLGFNQVYLLGETFYKVNSNFKKFRSFEEFRFSFNSTVKNTNFLIKGSRGMALERVLDLIH